MAPKMFLKSYYLRAFYFLFFIGLPNCAEIQRKVDSVSISQSQNNFILDNSFIPDGYYEIIPKISSKGYELKRLAENVYFFTTGIYNTLFVVSSEGVLIADPLSGSGELLKHAIAEVTDLPVKIMVYTHSHLDHIGDAHFFKSGVQIIAHKETRRLLKRYKDPRRPLPNISFERNYVLNFGEIKIELIFVSAGHDMGNIMIYIPDSKILMMVDVATPKAVPFKNFSTVDIFGQIIGIQRALKLEWDVYVAGHLYRPGKKAEMEEILDYYYASKAANVKALKNISLKKIIAKTNSKDIERIFGEYYDSVSNECYHILKKKWKQRLMGFEAFARGHCDVWTAFHRTNKTPEK